MESRETPPPLKIAVFFHNYQPFHQAKEGNLILGLEEAGAEVTLVTEDKSALHGHQPPYPVKSAPAADVVRPDFWAGLDADVVLAYTFLNWHFTPILRAVKNGGKALLVRADSDGNIGHPRLPRRFYVDPPWSSAGLSNLARRAAWRVCPRRMAQLRVEHLRLADAIFIESPGARANLASFLTYWKQIDLLERIHFVPMTIGDEFVTAPLREKSPSIVSVGRWTDWRQKNTTCAVRVLVRALAARPHCQAKIIGPGDGEIRKILQALPTDGQDRLSVTGSLPHSEVTESLATAQILFMPSNWEGFPLAAGEAACMGCSFAASPIDSLNLLSQGGRFGTLSPDFSEDGLLGALLIELDRWADGQHDPGTISSFWRPRIHRRAVGRQLLELAKQAFQRNRL